MTDQQWDRFLRWLDKDGAAWFTVVYVIVTIAALIVCRLGG